MLEPLQKTKLIWHHYEAKLMNNLSDNSTFPSHFPDDDQYKNRSR